MPYVYIASSFTCLEHRMEHRSIAHVLDDGMASCCCQVERMALHPELDANPEQVGDTFQFPVVYRNVLARYGGRPGGQRWYRSCRNHPTVDAHGDGMSFDEAIAWLEQNNDGPIEEPGMFHGYRIRGYGENAWRAE